MNNNNNLKYKRKLDVLTSKYIIIYMKVDLKTAFVFDCLSCHNIFLSELPACGSFISSNLVFCKC